MRHSSTPDVAMSRVCGLDHWPWSGHLAWSCQGTTRGLLNGAGSVCVSPLKYVAYMLGPRSRTPGLYRSVLVWNVISVTRCPKKVQRHPLIGWDTRSMPADRSSPSDRQGTRARRARRLETPTIAGLDSASEGHPLRGGHWMLTPRDATVDNRVEGNVKTLEPYPLRGIIPRP